MRNVELNEIATLDDGEPIPSLEGTVKMVFAHEPVSGQYGQSSKQNLILTDGETEVTVQAWGHEDLQSLVKKFVRFESNKSDKHGLTGIRKNVFESKGKVYHNVKLTGSCKIHVETNGSGKEGKEGKEPCKTQSTAAVPTVGSAGGASTLGERQRAIVRQHSQSMALELLKLKQALGELTVGDLNPSHLKKLADYFDLDVIEAAQ